MTRGTVWCTFSPFLAGVVVTAVFGCGGGSLGGAKPPPTGIGGRGGLTGGKGGTASGEGGGGGDATGTAGASSGEGGAPTGGGGSVGGAGGPTGSGGTYVGPTNNEVDILFMIDDSSEMTAMEEKLGDQIPVFLSSLESLPVRPSLHIAVVSSDMGAPGDATGSIGCTAIGDQG
ncbi:MAG TPA: hypothetical protein VGP64_07985, partial [Polyangia bacterium]